MDVTPYHHGNLRAALLEEARALVAEEGPGSFTLRELARRLGVSHAAPAHHFPDKRALLTALAAEGFERLAAELERARGDGLVELGLVYVRVAAEHPADFAVMFRTDLLDPDDAALRSAGERARAALREGVRRAHGSEDAALEVAAWSVVHGLAALRASGALAGEPAASGEAGARAVLERFVRGAGPEGVAAS